MVDESEAVPNIPLVPDEELDAMKIKISQIKNDIQREKVKWLEHSMPSTDSLCGDEVLTEAESPELHRGKGLWVLKCLSAQMGTDIGE